MSAFHRRSTSGSSRIYDPDNVSPTTTRRTSAGMRGYPRETQEAALAQARPSVAESIVIPPHILATISETKEWTPDPEKRRTSSAGSRKDTRARFDIVRIAQEQQRELHDRVARSHTVRRTTVGADAKPNAFEISNPRIPLRKTSLPTVVEGNMPGTQTPRSMPGSPKFQAVTMDDGNGEREVPVVELLSDNTVLFRDLSTYDMNNSTPSSSSKHSFEEADPFSDPVFVAPNEKVLDEEADGGLTRQVTTLSRIRKASMAMANRFDGVARKSSLADVYERAKARGLYLQRKRWVQIAFEYTFYTILLAFIYFVLVGRPLWKGAVWWLYWVVEKKFVVSGTWSITIGLAVIYAFTPLLILFEKEPPMPENTATLDPRKTPGVHNTALLIPCYKSEKIIGPTLEAAMKIFPAEHIYVIANGNSPTPLDKTADVCNEYGVNHIWSPVGSKIVAQFVGCYAAKTFDNVLLIDDDCALPANFPIVSDRMTDMVKCIGYTIKSVGPNSSKGTLCQQAQDLEYKISGLQRALAGKIGSATFPHGAISLWNTKFLIQTFHTHPGFSVSEDWFFGHVARKLGCRIKMCTAIFVETETPTAIFFAGGGSRGGFGEMSIFKQRFYRWNFFFVNGMYYNLAYIFGSWKLGWWEIGAKLFVFQEVYETLLYLLAPFVLPISLIVRPVFCIYLMVGTFGMYFINVTLFNEIHLRLRNERIGWVTTYLYYMPYKIVLTFINVFSCYWAMFKYATYFAKRHPKVIEDEKAVEVVLKLEEDTKPPPGPRRQSRARRLTVTAIGSRLSRASWRPSMSVEDTITEEQMTRPQMVQHRSQDKSPFSDPNHRPFALGGGSPTAPTTNPFADPKHKPFMLGSRRGAIETQDFALRKSSSLLRSEHQAHQRGDSSDGSVELNDVPGRPFAHEFQNTEWMSAADRKASMARSMV